jgi:hypothetical protein
MSREEFNAFIETHCKSEKKRELFKRMSDFIKAKIEAEKKSSAEGKREASGKNIHR